MDNNLIDLLLVSSTDESDLYFPNRIASIRLLLEYCRRVLSPDDCISTSVIPLQLRKTGDRCRFLTFDVNFQQPTLQTLA